ncbi:MAG: DMT family transporter, partial [Bacteriovoracaceae bacterium]|nr:DMT family transporter [Bacteriovoracaceae bacterium]
IGQGLHGWLPLLGLLIMVLGCTVIASFLQIWAQKRVESAVAGVLFLMEAPLALFFAWWVFDEVLKPLNYLGCLMILVACIVLSLEGGRKPAVRKATKMVKNF